MTRTRSPFSTRSTFAGISMYPSAWAIDVIAPLSLYAGTAIPSSTRTVWNSTRPIEETIDRKSTRLNSSHSQISYAVFCLKKKKKYILLVDIDALLVRDIHLPGRCERTATRKSAIFQV